MTFDDHWTKVLSFNPALAENPFLRPLAEAAWNAAAVAEREACANWLRRNANAEKDPAKRAAFIEAHNAILARSNAAMSGAEPALSAERPLDGTVMQED